MKTVRDWYIQIFGTTTFFTLIMTSSGLLFKDFWKGPPELHKTVKFVVPGWVLLHMMSKLKLTCKELRFVKTKRCKSNKTKRAFLDSLQKVSRGQESYSALFALEQHAQHWSLLHPTSSLGVKTNLIKRSDAQRPTIWEAINQRCNCHGMRGMVGGWLGSASQKTTHAFPDLLAQFPPRLLLPHLERHISQRKMSVAADCRSARNSRSKKMNTNTCKRCSWHAQTCVWGENNTRACKKAYFMRKGTWNSMAITQYGKYELDSEHLCQIVLTSIQHTWLICPSQFPSWLGEGLQRTKLRRSHDMLQS